MEKMGKYKFKRSTLQFDKGFIEWLDTVKGDMKKNKYIEKMCGYKKEENKNDSRN